MAEQTPGKLPGDIVLILKQKDHPQFARHGNDLSTVVHVPLKDALTGFSHTFTHLDGHTVELETDPASDANQIIFPNQKRRLKQEGMPVHNVPSEFGDLEVTFEVLFPDHLTPEQMEQLRRVL
jgi:DnaJ-class molecular chaperone